jgi:hypothetical protein
MKKRSRQIYFVDAASLKIARVDLGAIGAEEHSVIWRAGDELVIAYSRPSVGDIAWVNLQTHGKTVQRAPRSCSK